MQMGKDQFEDAIATLKEWFAQAEKPGAAAYFALAIAYYQLEQLDNAIEPAKKAIELAENPQQGWYQLLLAIYLKKEDYASATPVLVAAAHELSRPSARPTGCSSRRSTACRRTSRARSR
jgi:tetratricopeptide (TPR) repeat protein